MLFRFVLLVVGSALYIASRTSARVRSQLARDLSIVVASTDGVARTFTVRARRFSSRAGGGADPVCRIVFRTAAIGARIFLARDTVGRIVRGLGDGDVVCDGDPAFILWFYELTMGLVRPRPPRKPMPDGYTAPDPRNKVADRITREPVASAIDPRWAEAIAQREHLLIWEVGVGAELSGKFKRHQVVSSVPDVLPESES